MLTYQVFEQLPPEIALLRRIVFIEEQQIDPNLEYDQYDQLAIHVGIYLAHQLIGCGRIIIIDEEYYLGRIAIDQNYRLQGYGYYLVEVMEKIILAHENNKLGNPRYIYLHAQLPVKEFYQKCGYHPSGETFEEAGIKHILMKKLL